MMSQLEWEMEEILAYSKHACVPTGLKGKWEPSHTVELRLDRCGTDYVHGYSVLRAVDGALSRPGINPVSLDRFTIRKKITEHLLLSVGDNPHTSQFGDGVPAVEIVVTFEDGVQRKIYGYESGSKIDQRTDVPFLPFTGVSNHGLVMAKKRAEKLRWTDRHGHFISNWAQFAAREAYENVEIPHSPTGNHNVLLHSILGFQLPDVMDAFTEGIMDHNTRTTNIRPLKNVQGGKFVSTHIDLIKNGRRKGGGTINFAFVPFTL